ncbi:2-hydroxyacid dehydrogenase [Paracoccus contaminans]|nr:2-hydroxyacid dehydrogenase [Paracoccus contaminans]
MILAIGSYSQEDRTALDAMGAAHLASLQGLAALPQDQRAGIKGVAYKGGHPFGAAQMDLLPALRVIANFGVGHDAIDVPAATARGITVTNTPAVLNDDVADLAVAMWIALNRGFEPAIAHVRMGGWARGEGLALGRKASGRRVGILGLGRIGREIADRLAAFKCEIHYWSRGAKDVPWTHHADPTALARAVDDLIVIIVGGPDTEGLVSAALLDALGPDGVLVNVARGSVVDEAALIERLADGRLRGAALDVFRGEPQVDLRLLALPNLLALPHIGSATVETRAAMGDLQRRNLAAVLDGRPAETPVN